MEDLTVLGKEVRDQPASTSGATKPLRGTIEAEPSESVAFTLDRYPHLYEDASLLSASASTPFSNFEQTKEGELNHRRAQDPRRTRRQTTDAGMRSGSARVLLDDGGHDKSVCVCHVASRIRLKGGPFRRRVVGTILRLQLLMSNDPQEAIVLAVDPSADHGEAKPSPQREDERLPLTEPCFHLARANPV